MRVNRLLADELAFGGRVTAWLPSVIDTPPTALHVRGFAARAVPPSAIAKVIGFLCSEDAWPISGARFRFDGQGLTARAAAVACPIDNTSVRFDGAVAGGAFSASPSVARCRRRRGGALRGCAVLALSGQRREHQCVALGWCC